ncbi:DUF418 domain-containing protein [Steroidobacter sp. S1-65]|uniref:DUF418 domain-containing protein n=1 Tax=Steroidobacter gossypii TaxID=2805490 RepID=A0ABS1WRW0_9GAMM|nr:DUF418 domain-containing protein [Steroidobacter gossypii]MBM0103710.1 DUF418 domain-containing protein [Steroidobacter gossypii]
MSSELAPTTVDDRIGMLDSIRGIAVLGILMMNITGFGLPYAYDNPLVWGLESSADLTVWRIMTLLFEGTMRGLFTLLFGASALLFLSRHAARTADLRPADLYFRRTLWLMVFGLINGYVLLWSGDVLLYYGVAGLFLFVFRNLAPRQLLLLAAALMTLQTMITVSEWNDYREVQSLAAAASARQAAGLPLTDGDQEALDALEVVQNELRPARENLEASVANVRASYLSAFAVLSSDTWYMQSEFFFRHGLVECLGMMLLGMALLKSGVLSGRSPTRVYGAMMVVGYAIGLTINTIELRQIEAGQFSPDTMLRTFITYDLGRIPMTLGHLGAIALLCRAQWFSGASRVLASVGQLALTNYLTQSLFCLFIFTGAGLAWYGQLARHELYYVVLAIWVVQLAWSPIWVRHFRYGPAEWIWRSLTYCQWQPFRRGSTAARATASA